MSYFDYEPEFLTDDPGFLRLKPEAGYLFTLLVHRMMRHGHLAPDKEFYRILWGIRFRDFTKAWDQATSVIARDDQGFMWVEWVDDMRLATETHLKSERERKRNARMARRESTVSAGLPPDVRGMSAGCPGRRTDGRTDGRTEQISEAKPRPVPEKPKKASSGEHAEFIAWWTEAFQKATGAPYGFQGGKDGSHVKRILERAGGAPEARRRATLLLASAPEWIAKGGIDLGTLDTQWNKLVSAGATGVATGSKQLAIQGMNGERVIPQLAPLPTTKGGHR